MPKMKAKYVSPQLRRVPLVAEEAVLVVCKIGSAGTRNVKCNKSVGSCVKSSNGS